MKKTQISIEIIITLSVMLIALLFIEGIMFDKIVKETKNRIRDVFKFYAEAIKNELSIAYSSYRIYNRTIALPERIAKIKYDIYIKNYKNTSIIFIKPISKEYDEYPIVLFFNVTGKFCPGYCNSIIFKKNGIVCVNSCSKNFDCNLLSNRIC